MDIISAKIALKEKGYCWFNLKELNTTYYDYLYTNYKCSKEKNLKEVFTSLRADYRDVDNSDIPKRIFNEYNTINDVERVQNEIIETSDDIIQIWRFAGYGKVLRYLNLPSTDDCRITDIFNSIAKYFYDTNKEINQISDFTYYDIGCRLTNHTDGFGNGRLCACLIYLNETYKMEDGGLLILNNEMKIIPEIGNVAIIDLQSFNISHMVSEVKSGIGRYAILSFMNIKGDHLYSENYK